MAWFKRLNEKHRGVPSNKRHTGDCPKIRGDFSVFIGSLRLQVSQPLFSSGSGSR